MSLVAKNIQGACAMALLLAMLLGMAACSSEAGRIELQTASQGLQNSADSDELRPAIVLSDASAQAYANANLALQRDRSWWQPEAGARWQIQLTGRLNLSYNARIYTIDLFDHSAQTIADLQASGVRVVCYFSAGTYENWREDASRFPQSVVGRNLADWPGERWLDIRSSTVRNLMLSRLDVARDKGCDAVEADNVDAYTNGSGFALSYRDQLNYNRFLSIAAHQRGLSVGLKNNLDQIEELEPYFDFAVNESCHRYSECQRLRVFVQKGKAVLQIEYREDLLDNESALKGHCTVALNQGFTALLMPRQLDDSFRIACH